MILSSILFRLDRIYVSLATADLLIVLQEAIPEGAVNVQERFGYLQLLHVQRAITKFVHKKILLMKKLCESLIRNTVKKW
jgi:hypothetical protein